MNVEAIRNRGKVRCVISSAAHLEKFYHWLIGHK